MRLVDINNKDVKIKEDSARYNAPTATVQEERRRGPAEEV